MFVQAQPGVFEPREVQLGFQSPKEALVTRGLEVGEKVVSENMLLLARQYRVAKDGSKAESPSP